MKKLPNDIVDQRLYSRNIQRLDDYIDKETKISFQCLTVGCDYVWSAKPGNIFNGRGCPKCARLAKLSNEVVDQNLLNRNISRLDDIVNNKILTRFKCLICYHIWKTSADSVLNRNTGCPNCQKLSGEEVDLFLRSKNIKRVDRYIDTRTPITFQCLFDHCSYCWITSPNHILYDETGCPKCVGNIVLDDEIIDQRLLERNIKRVGKYVNIYTKIKFQCMINKCNHIWEAIPNNILNLGTGCPNCSFGKNETIVFNVLSLANIRVERFKHIKGITGGETRNLIVDFYIPDNKTIIEYNGEQHYQPVCFGGMDMKCAENNFTKQQQRDLYLQHICDTNNIKLIWIDGRKWINSKLEKYVIEYIIGEIK